MEPLHWQTFLLQVRLDNAVSQGLKVKASVAYDMIQRGEVSVDGVVISEPAWQVLLPVEQIRASGVTVQARFQYILHRNATGRTGPS